MEEILFKNMRALGDEDLEGYAKEIGLDIDQFKADFASDAVKKEVQDDMAAAQKSGQVRGTPSIFINGKKYGGQRTTEAVRAVVEEEIKRADALLGKGVSLEQLYEKLSSEG